MRQRLVATIAGGLAALSVLTGCGADNPWATEKTGTLATGDPADFPQILDHWTRQAAWSDTPRAFSGDTWTLTSGPDHGDFPATMNGCDGYRFLVRWRAVDDGAQVLAASVDNTGSVVNKQVTAHSGRMDLDGCGVPAFRLGGDQENGSTLTDVTVQVQEYQAAP